jgi:hypothetical protein
MTTALGGGEWSASRPGRTLAPGKTRYPLYRRLGGPQGRSGQMRKISPPTRIRSPDRPARSQSLYRLSYPAHDICTRAKDYVRLLIYYTQSLNEMGGAILHLCIIESTRQVSYFYLMTKSAPGSKKGVSLNEIEAMENTQRKCHFTFNQVSHPAARTA